jgi:hypothetical protein
VYTSHVHWKSSYVVGARWVLYAMYYVNVICISVYICLCMAARLKYHVCLAVYNILANVMCVCVCVCVCLSVSVSV